MGLPTLVYFSDESNTEFFSKAQATFNEKVAHFLTLKSKEEVIDFANNHQLDLVVLKLDPRKQDTIEIHTILEKTGKLHVNIYGTTYDEAVAQMMIAIHESRVRMLRYTVKRDVVRGIICFVAIIALAYFSKSQIARFLGAFIVTMLLFECLFFYVGTIAQRKIMEQSAKKESEFK